MMVQVQVSRSPHAIIKEVRIRFEVSRLLMDKGTASRMYIHDSIGKI